MQTTDEFTTLKRTKRAEIDVITMFRRLKNKNMKQNFVSALLESMIRVGYLEIKNPQKLRSIAPDLWSSLLAGGLVH